MQNTVDERKQNGDDFFLSLAVTYFRSGNCPANGLVTEQPQYSVAICFFTTWQNTETMLISNGLRFIFICSLSLALPCIFHCSRHSFATIARNDCGFGKDDIAMCLNHSSGRSVTDSYIKEDYSVIEKVIKGVVKFVFGE